ncbi:MAG: DUF1800 domain-containing protein [Burkholderiales bacterium]|nr:DUF1800 domain-containing protein [Burkholderiales bacterium]
MTQRDGNDPHAHFVRCPQRGRRSRSGRPFARASTFAFAACLGATLALPAAALEPTAQVVEFYNASLKHYFVTAFPEEAAMLDAGNAVKGWARTGVTFSAWLAAADDPDAVPVCRFFGKPDAGPNSHFYTADAAECAAVKANPDWVYEAVAFHIRVPQNGACPGGTEAVYRSFYPGATVSESNHRFLTDLTMHQKMAGSSTLEGVVMCAPLSTAQRQADAVRLLEQATFGPTDALVAHVLAVGTDKFLDEQLAAAGSRYSSNKYVPAGGAATYCATDPNPYCARDYYSLFQLRNDFFRNALANGDQLRQRVAFALSQILVTSGLDINVAYGMAIYQQLFLDHAFDNYETLLTRVTLSSVMGEYLNMVNNDKPVAGTNPNENYARELLQLFSIGLWEQGPDGTLLRDANGEPIPTYDQSTVEGFAHVFTGWTFPVLPGQPPRTHNFKNFLGEMVGVAGNHDTGAKSLLYGAVAPAGLTMDADLANAIRNVFFNPNVGPFIGKQLIQKLVTGDPSPQYVGRVAAVFNNNGQGVRGDMKAVVRAILADPEARGAVKLDPGYGKLREPVLFLTAAARSVNTATDGVYFGPAGAALGQNLFYPESVFNYYPPDYVLPGSTLLGPEFALANASTYINRANVANTLAFGVIAPTPTYPGATGTRPDWTALQAVAADTGALIAKVDALLLHGAMPPAMRAGLASAIDALPASDTLSRAKTAYYLVVTSSEYQVER